MEKTSHRIGRIIHESDIPKEGVVSLLGTPPNLAASYMDDDEFEMEVPQPQTEAPASVDSNVLSKSQEEEAEQQLKNPSKVVLLSVRTNVYRKNSRYIIILLFFTEYGWSKRRR